MYKVKIKLSYVNNIIDLQITDRMSIINNQSDCWPATK